MLSLSANPILAPKPRTAATVESALRRLPHLTGDTAHQTGRTRRTYLDARKSKCATDALGRLPAADEAMHLAISGRFALWHIVPAILELSGCACDELTIATLGFSRQNVVSLCELLDAGIIKSARLLASLYFSATSADLYTFAQEEIAKRSDRAKLFGVRNHAKLLLLKMTDGRTFTIESSANLRSCKNIETAAIIGDPGLYEFHRGWIHDLFERGERS